MSGPTAQIPAWADDEWYDFVVALHAAAVRLRRVAAEQGGVPRAAPSPVDDETLDFLVGLLGAAERIEEWVDRTAAAGGGPLDAVPPAPPRLEAGRILR